MNAQPTFTDRLRKIFKGILDPIGKFLNNLGLTPNTITLLGLAGTSYGAYLLSQGKMTLGGIVLFLFVIVDAFDGTMARLRGESSAFGAFVDSVTDRYSELVIFGGLLVCYLRTENWLGSLLIYLAAAGSVLVSYVRARGQSLEMDTKVGLLTRVERFLVLAPCLIINQPMIALWILAVLTNVTALQRIADVRRQAYANNRIARKNPPKE